MGNVIYLFLPLCTTQQQLKYILDKTYGVLKTWSQKQDSIKEN